MIHSGVCCGIKTESLEGLHVKRRIFSSDFNLVEMYQLISVTGHRTTFHSSYETFLSCHTRTDGHSR